MITRHHVSVYVDDGVDGYYSDVDVHRRKVFVHETGKTHTITTHLGYTTAYRFVQLDNGHILTLDF